MVVIGSGSPAKARQGRRRNRPTKIRCKILLVIGRFFIEFFTSA